MSHYRVTVKGHDAEGNEWTADYAVTVLTDGRHTTYDEQGYDPDLELERVSAKCDPADPERTAHASMPDLDEEACESALAYYWDNYCTEDE